MRKNILKTICFLLLLAALLVPLQYVFTQEDRRPFHVLTGFYREPENSLDAVYIGASTTYAFWQPALGWDEYGIAVYSLATPSMTVNHFKYMVREARKTQPDALYIIDLNRFRRTRIPLASMHALTDFMPLSVNKIRMVYDVMGHGKDDILGNLEFFLPILRFHERWSTLTPYDFYHPVEQYKASQTYSTFLSTRKNVREKYVYTDEAGTLEPLQEKNLNSFLDFCDKENVRVLFVNVPQALGSSETVAAVNRLEEIVSERGFDVISFLGDADAMGLDPKTDFYNQLHTNIHGSFKYTHYLGQILADRYGFSDKHGDPAYESWNQAAELYMTALLSDTLDFERERLPRDYTL